MVHRSPIWIPLLAAIAIALTGPEPRAQEGTSNLGHARTRQVAAAGVLPKPGDVVVEDIVNYHRHGLPVPKAGATVALDVRWGRPDVLVGETAILQVGWTTARIHDKTRLDPVNLALVIDKSGSMNEAGKMDRVRIALDRFLGQLRPDDRIAIVAYDDAATCVLASGTLGDGAAARTALRALAPDGATNLHAGLMAGFEQVSAHRLEIGANRVILLTDGIANHGVTDPEQILGDARRFIGVGIDLSTIGVGMDLNRGLLRQLAEAGRGLCHFVADDEDVEKVFVRELQSLISPVARDVSLELRWTGPARLEELYGYEPRRAERSIRIPVASMNHGLTQVVLADVLATATGTIAVDVTLSFFDLARDERRELTGRVALPVGEATGSRAATVDDEVVKNHTIAVLALGLRRMAESVEKEQLAQAERRLAEALATATDRFPSEDDVDVERVRKMVRDCRKILTAHVQRFRDL